MTQALSITGNAGDQQELFTKALMEKRRYVLILVTELSGEKCRKQGAIDEIAGAGGVWDTPPRGRTAKYDLLPDQPPTFIHKNVAFSRTFLDYLLHIIH